MFDSEFPLHPQPQMARARWLDLCGPWSFAYDDTDVGLDEQWQARDDVYTHTIQVPFPPESPASGIGDTSFHPVVWYRRTFDRAREDSGKRLILHCGAIDYAAMVWVNGQLLASHQGGNTPFRVDITRALRTDGPQVLVIRAEDNPWDLAQPRGKQDWREQPHSIWYHRTTGIWQPIWLEPVATTHITDLRWTPDLDRAVLSLRVTLQRATLEPVRVRMQLSLHGVSIVDDIALVQGSELTRDLVLDLGSLTMSQGEILWSPGHPNLIEAVISVMVNDEAIDEVQSYAGLRSVSVSGGRFLLNGTPYYLRMALAQGYWPQTHLAAPSNEALRREVELAKELGFNGLRIHQKVEDPRFLYWCDRLGMVVWGEMANAYVFSPDALQRLTREWLEVVDRDTSHPCIVVWVPLNESWGVPNLLRDLEQQHFVQSIYHLTKALDDSRPTIANDGWEYLTGDIFGIHDYTFQGDTIRERYGTTEAINRTLREVQPQYRFVTLSNRQSEGIPVMLTEFGGISFHPQTDDTWYGYGTVVDRKSYGDKYRELVEAVLDCRTISGFCYTQLTDTLQETNGLLTENREFKVDPALIRSINRRASGAVPGDLVAQMQNRSASPFGSGSPAPDTHVDLL